jgi:uncharacterized caspase-like protein
MNALRGAKGLKMALLDACRNNPFAAMMRMLNASRSVSRGLAAVEPAGGTLVGFAAKEGTTASDGGGRNSPYTAALMEHIEQPGVEINLLFRKVRDSVLEATGGVQEPFVYGSLPGAEIYLKTPQAVAGPQTDETAVELAYWQSIKDTRNPELLKSYLAKYSDGAFADLAKAMIATLAADATNRKAEAERAQEEAQRQSAFQKEDIELAYWNAVKDAKDASLYEAYLQRYPKGKFAEVAKALIARIGSEQKAAEERAQAEARKAEAAQRATSLAHQTPAQVSEEAKEITYWESIRNSRSRKLYDVYLNKYPDGMFAAIARTQIEEIDSVERAGKAAPVPHPTEPKAAPPKSRQQAARTPAEPPPEKEATVAGSKSGNIQGCRANDLNACRRACQQGAQRSCVKVKCLSGDRSSCGWLKATHDRSTSGGFGSGGGRSDRRPGGF